MEIVIVTHSIAAGAGAGAEMPEGSEDDAGLWKDGHQLLERGAILHLLPPLMTSGERLLTLLLMKFALGSRQVKIMPMKTWTRRMIKRWVATDYVLDSPYVALIELTRLILGPTIIIIIIIITYYGACTTSICVKVDC